MCNALMRFELCSAKLERIRRLLINDVSNEGKIKISFLKAFQKIPERCLFKMLFSVSIEKSKCILRLYNGLHALVVLFYLVAFYHFLASCYSLTTVVSLPDRSQFNVLFWTIMLVLFVSTLMLVTPVLGLFAIKVADPKLIQKVAISSEVYYGITLLRCLAC